MIGGAWQRRKHTDRDFFHFFFLFEEEEERVQERKKGGARTSQEEPGYGLAVSPPKKFLVCICLSSGTREVVTGFRIQDPGSRTHNSGVLQFCSPGVLER